VVQYSSKATALAPEMVGMAKRSRLLAAQLLTSIGGGRTGPKKL
jgi:hypothetical protein